MTGRLIWHRILAASLLSLPSPTLAFYLLHASGPLALPLAYVLLVELCFLLLALGRLRRAAAIAAGILLTGGALVIFTALDVTPASAFLAWFKLVRDGEAGGTVSYMFAIFFAYFSAIAAGIALVADLLVAASVYLLVHAFLVAVILMNVPLTLIAVFILVAFLALRTLRHLRGGKITPLASILQVVAAAGIIAGVLTPLSPRNPFVDGLFAAKLEGPISDVFPGFPFLYNVPGYGHSFSQSDRGGRPVLTSRPVFRVTGAPGQTIYLRSAVYDTYGPSGWEQSSTARATAESEQRKSLIVESGPAKTAASGPELRVEVLIDFYAHVPSALNVVAVWPLSGELPPLSYGSEETGYLLSVPVTRGFVFVETQAPRPASNRPLPVDLQVPGLSLRVQRLATELRRPTPGETLSAIRAYLASDYDYTLNIEPYRAGTSPVADFLFVSHKGYCVQFATALALLARLDGIPTRYVTGFLVNIPNNANTATVTGLSAHAWVEAFLPGRGWTTVEATPPMMRSAIGDPGYYHLFNRSGSPYTARQLLAIMGNRVPAPATTTPPRQLFPLVPVAALLAAALLLFLAARTLRLALMSRRSKLRRLARLAVRRSFASGAPDPEYSGWWKWAAATGAATRRHEAIERAVKIAQAVFFGERATSKRDIRFLTSVNRLLRHRGR